MSGMFKNAAQLNSLDISNWDTESATNMAELFYGATNLNPSVTSFSFASVTNAQDLFKGTALDTAHYDSFLQRAFSTSTTNKDVPVGEVPAAHTYNVTYLNYKNQLAHPNFKNWIINDETSINNKIVLVYNLTAGSHSIILPVRSDATD